MIDTSVEGTVSAVTGLAIWLRDTLQANLTEAGDLSAAGRQIASGEWEGQDASAYSSYSRKVVTLTDDHASRVGRAASACEAYATRLSEMKSTMSGIRGRAVSGGLSVSGDTIQEPPVVEATVLEAGSPEEAAHQAAVAKVELYNTLSTDTMAAWTSFDEWIQANLVPDVTDAQETGGTDTVLGEIASTLPNALSGVAAGLTGRGLGDIADKYRDQAREFRRKSRVSGDPRVRGQADTPGGKSQLDDLLGKSSWFGKAGRLLSGPAGIGIDLYFGYREGSESGDWTRAALTTGSSIAVGLGVTALVAAGVITAPAWAVVVGAGALAAGVSYGVGYVYDHWDDISGWAGDRWDDASEIADDAWEGTKDFADDVTDKAGDAWDKVTPW